jgi:small subunit ribosomal protein S2
MINENILLKKGFDLKTIKIRAKELLSSISKSSNTKIKLNSNNKSFFLTKKKDLFILDLIQLAKQINLVEKIVYLFAKKKKNILFVGTNSQISNFLFKDLQAFSNNNCFYISSRWIGGFITNWFNFKNKLNKLNSIKNIEQTISKKEYNYNKKEIIKLSKNFEGIKNLSELPDLVIFLSLEKNSLAAQECKTFGIPTISFFNNISLKNNTDIEIFINTNSLISSKYITEILIKQITKANTN